MKLFVDDVRQLPASMSDWTLCRSAKQAIAFLSTGTVRAISLDHDMGGKKTGYDVIVYIEEKVFFGKIPMPLIYVHTANPVARKKMQDVVERMRSRTYAYKPEV